MKNTLILFCLISILCAGEINCQHINTNAPDKNDAFREMMNLLGIDEKDLGFQPKGYWTRYPDPKKIPYKLPAFDDLFAEPHRIYDFVRLMALSVHDFLHPDYITKNSDALLKAGFYCGIRNATGQFRDYSASLWAELDQTEPLLKAIKEIYIKTGEVYRYNAVGKASDFPLIEENLRRAIVPINYRIQRVVARTVLNLLEAYRFRNIGMRNIDWKQASDCWRIRHLGETQFDGLEYFPQLEDCAQNLDFNSIYYAGLKLLESSKELADSLTIIKNDKNIKWDDQNLNVITPIGRIVIAGTKNDFHEYSDLLLLVDIGGDDTYKGSTGSTPSLNIPVSLAVDLAGNDTYTNSDEFLPSQGAAIFGAAMLLDLSGNDVYRSKRLSQGAAMFGIGILADMQGNDEYHMWTSGQGGAYFGIGLAIDVKGDDNYKIWGDGQGYGGIGGVGTLIDRTGNDHYWAEPKSENVFRPDYHSKDGKLNYSYAQGCGVGRRGDITDGHSWAGGIGTLIDLSGNDIYESANWSLGCGYWYGMGFLYDGAGDDKYISASWTQAAGAHFCIGALFDEGGNDEHILWEDQSVGLGFGHDYTIAVLLNRGGDDLYKLKDDGLGFAINKSQVFFFDTGGNDSYITGGKGNNYGWNNFESNNPPGVESVYHLYSNQICLFADLKGNDSYNIINYVTNEETVDSRMKNGTEIFFQPDHNKFPSLRYFGLGKDFDNWDGPEIEYFMDKMRKKFPKFG